MSSAWSPTNPQHLSSRSGIAEPHGVLAAEEFAMPAPRSSSGGRGAAGIAAKAARPAGVGALAAVALLIRRALRRRAES